MRLLYITAEVPYPLTSGYLRHFHLLRLLSQRHHVVLLSLTRRGVADPEARIALAPYVERMRVFGSTPARRTRLHRSLDVRGAALELREAVREHVAAGDADAVVLTGKDTFPALAEVGRTPLVVDVCDAASLRLRGELELAPGRRRALLAMRLAEVRRIERRLAARTPHLLFASERDRQAVLGDAGGIVMPNAVDLEYWRRSGPTAADRRIAFTGVMAYRPNHDAAMRLVGDVLPRVRARQPSAELVVAGRDPLPALRAAAGAGQGVEVTGACADLRPHVEEAAVYCAPLRFAAGIQNKLLEALAMEVPVVTTPVAAAGLRVAGQDAPMVVAEDDDDLADAIARLLDDPAERRRLGTAGRRFVERHFSWDRSVALLEHAIADAVAGAAPAPPPRPRREDLRTAVRPS